MAVGDEGGAVESLAGAEPDARCDLVADVAGDAGGGEDPEVVRLLRVDESQDGLEPATQALMKIAATTARPASRSPRAR